jgi:hypothetical protein
MELATKKTLDDSVEWVKVSGAAWQGNGFYYSRYPAPEKGKEKASINENHQVYYHRVGTPQSQDELVYQDAANPQRFHFVGTTEDERFALLSISERGKGKDGNALFIRDLSKGDKEFRPVVAEIGDSTFDVIDNVGDKLLVATNHNAPNSRVVLIDPANPAEGSWTTVLAEKPEPLQGASTAGGKLFVTYLKDVTTRAAVHGLDGKLENEIALPGPGIAGGFGGERDAKFVFYTFNSLNVPPTIYRYDIATMKSTVFRAPKVPGYDPTAFETKQVFYPSKDGTKVPMFLVYRKGLKLDGNNPTLLYGYGGFNVVQAPTFSAARLALLEQGFVYASANMRGGGEYGRQGGDVRPAGQHPEGRHDRCRPVDARVPRDEVPPLPVLVPGVVLFHLFRHVLLDRQRLGQARVGGLEQGRHPVPADRHRPGQPGQDGARRLHPRDRLDHPPGVGVQGDVLDLHLPRFLEPGRRSRRVGQLAPVAVKEVDPLLWGRLLLHLVQKVLGVDGQDGERVFAAPVLVELPELVRGQGPRLGAGRRHPAAGPLLVEQGPDGLADHRVERQPGPVLVPDRLEQPVPGHPLVPPPQALLDGRVILA